MNKIHTQFRKSSCGLLRGPFRIAAVVLSVFLLTIHSAVVKAEGSCTWNVTANRQANLFVPSNSADPTNNTGYRNRGFMLLASDAGTAQVPYNPAHRLYVWVKKDETVFWGFRSPSGGANITFNWYYDSNPATGLGYFPTATGSGNGRQLRQSQQVNVTGNGGAQGRPANAAAAAAGPSALSGGSYNAYSFTNNTNEDRAFWLEINTYNREFNFWDITVASGTAGNYVRQNGRVYCKYWSLVNDLPGTMGESNSGSFPVTTQQQDGFGFYIPIDNTRTTINDFFVKYANFGGSNAGYVIFFANSEGPGTTGSVDEKRRSMAGTSSKDQYPLFLNDPDGTVWPSAIEPIWDVSGSFSKKPHPETGGQGTFTVESNTPGVVDILIDLDENLNGQYDEGIDIRFTHEFTPANFDPGTQKWKFSFNWDGKYGNGTTDVEPNTPIRVITSMAFFPVHFPIYDMEQSLGIRIRHMRPGNPYNDVLYWDDSGIPDVNVQVGNNPSNVFPSRQSIKSNLNGLPGPQHIWHANNDNGFSQNNTINTWTGAFNKRSEFAFNFNFDVEVDLAVVKKVSREGGEPKDSEVAGIGELVTFTITAKNLAITDQQEVTATGVNVRDILPLGYEFVSMDLPDGTTWDDNNKDWVIGDLPVGEEEWLTLTIVARVVARGDMEDYRNVAVIRGNESEKNTDNNRDDATLEPFKVSGNVFHDPNAGNVDISADGGINTIPSGLYASLLDGQGKVLLSVPVPAIVNIPDDCVDDCPVAGAFSFNVIPGEGYTVVIGNNTLSPGSSPSAPLPLPTGWLNTGDFIGAPGTGTNTTSIDGKSEPFDVVNANVININFGIQQRPVSHDKGYTIDEPQENSIITLNGTGLDPGPLTGSDPEDYPGGGFLKDKMVHITSLPENGILSYDGEVITSATPEAPFVIQNYDPDKLKITFTGKGYNIVFFNYAYVDIAGARSTPTQYTISWTPLPVKWKSIDVTEENRHAVVSWSTTEELNVDYFEVQYSTDARSWQTIGIRKAMNTASAGYSYTHKLDRHSIHYFRIQNIDLDGSISRSPVVSLKGGKESAGITLYPNPVVNGELTLDIPLVNVKSVRVFSTAGVLLKSETPKSSTLDVRNLAGGVYILQVVYGNGETASKTFIVR